MRFVSVGALAWLVAACGSPAPAPATTRGTVLQGGAPGVPTTDPAEVPVPSRVTALIEALPDEHARWALRAISDPTTAETRELLEAADALHDEPRQQLTLLVVAQRFEPDEGDESLLPAIRAIAERLDPSSLLVPLRMLVRIGTERAIDALIELVPNAVSLPIDALITHPRHASLLFPQLFERAPFSMRPDAFVLAARWALSTPISSAALAIGADLALDSLERLPERPDREADIGAHHHRLTAIEMLGAVSSPAAERALVAESASPDPWLRAVALAARARRGHEVDGEILRLAQEEQHHLLIYDALRAAHQTERLPEALRATRLVARGRVARVGEALGASVTSVEHVRTVTLSLQGRPRSLELFRYRATTEDPELGRFECEGYGIAGADPAHAFGACLSTPTTEAEFLESAESHLRDVPPITVP